MTRPDLGARARAALRQRLAAVAEVLLEEVPPPPYGVDSGIDSGGDSGVPGRGDSGMDATAGGDPGADTPDAIAAAVLLDALAADLVRDPAPDRVWLLLVAVSTVLPTADDVHDARRAFELSSPVEAAIWLLETCFAQATAHGEPTAHLDVLAGEVVVDVDYCARHDLHTGIQRVVRETVPRWVGEHPLRLVAWTDRAGALRDLDPAERLRVLEWDRWRALPAADRARVVSSGRGPGPHAPRLVVPWRSTLLLPEVPGTAQCPRHAALAELSGNAVAAIGYDCIPVVSADLLPLVEPSRFVRYLTVVKHAQRVAGISVSATTEFRGFAATLPAQGLVGPRVSECPLPVEVPRLAAAPPPLDGADPLVLVVGSHEPRKNHLAVLHAAEVLWRSGRRFRLRFIGGSGWSHADFDARLAELRRAGRDVTAERSIGDEALWAAYRSARFTVFPSLHEGFGLPVAESLACGTPAIATDYGSTAELAKDGGVLLVDPRDDDALTDAVRRLLDDDDELARLRAAARARPPRSWADYSRECWAALVGGGRDLTAAGSAAGSTGAPEPRAAGRGSGR